MLKIHNNEIIQHDFKFPLKALIYRMKPIEVVLSSYSGYLGNDKIEINIEIIKSNATLSTLGYTMVLELTTTGTVVNMNINLVSSVFHHVPHPLILGRLSKLQQCTVVNMDSNSSLVFLDSFVVGRIHMKESYDFTSLANKCYLFYEKKLVLLEKTFLDPKNINFRPFVAQGTLILINYHKSFQTIYSKELSITTSYVKFRNTSIGQIIRIGSYSSDYFWETIQNMVK
eukprot:NODE_644_length_5619_cov_0.132790.p3 type:complete len:228 gc:universal NODE_644_length_5619_cov_0.132790:951-268(-)